MRRTLLLSNNTNIRSDHATAVVSPLAGKSYDVKSVELSDRRWIYPVADPNKKFTMICPPPNVTGKLHIGHALTFAIEDAIVRRKKMSGYDCLWVPGTDHAGIATQVVVEKALKRKTGRGRHHFGRERFVEYCHEWKRDKEEEIITQIKRMGPALDWSHYTFTLSPDYSSAVTEAFCRLYEKGLIYRAARLVNWCPALMSVISDIEVEIKEIPNSLLHIIDYGNV